MLKKLATRAALVVKEDDEALTISVSIRSEKLMNVHQRTTDPMERTRLQSYAWQEFQRLTDNGVDTAGGEEISSLLTTWVYFAGFWDGGVDGPTKKEQLEPTDRYEAYMALLEKDPVVPDVQESQKTPEKAVKKKNKGKRSKKKIWQ